MCGDLFCSCGMYYKSCARWVRGSFVAAEVTLVVARQGHLCWARPNGVYLLGGAFSPTGRFSSSSKFNLFLKCKSLSYQKFLNLLNENLPSDNRICGTRRFSICTWFQPDDDVVDNVDNNTFYNSIKLLIFLSSDRAVE